MSVFAFLAIAAGVYWYLGGGKTAPKTVVPVPKETQSLVVEESPRWHKFDVLLELQACLRSAGADEKEIKAIAEKAAVLLLGGKGEE